VDYHASRDNGKHGSRGILLKIHKLARRTVLSFAVCAGGFIVAGFLGGSGFSAPQTATARPSIFPLAEIRPGLKGVGRSVFEGSKIEEFQVDVLGVLKNISPRQSVILARLSGGQVERTGVLAGMSGSPVYIDGRLAGAVALGFQFSKEPIAGITPIEEMLQSSE